VVGGRRRMATLSSMMENDSHPIQEAVTALESSFSDPAALPVAPSSSQ